MIFETHGPVDYNQFERQLRRDFRGSLFQPRHQRGSILREVRLLLPDSKIARACAMYDLPHGSELGKKWPQWRIAYKRMFEALEAASLTAVE